MVVRKGRARVWLSEKVKQECGCQEWKSKSVVVRKGRANVWLSGKVEQACGC